MRRALRGLIPPAAKAALRETLGARVYARPSYAQEGEDLVLLRMFEGTHGAGIYVDVGAHHPFRFSNTALLHAKGWRGINIDAKPGSMAAFRRFRPNDVNLEVGVDEVAAQLQFNVFAEPALNTFDEGLARQRRTEGWEQLGAVDVKCRPLAEILSQYLPALGSQAIDLLSVDVEGLDLQVLRSNDWNRYRPRIIVIEVLNSNLEQVLNSDSTRFLAGKGYKPVSKLVNSTIFANAD